MTQELKNKIAKWVKDELPHYIRECGTNEYRSYMIDDAQELFAPGDQDSQNEVSDLVFGLLNGTIAIP